MKDYESYINEKYFKKPEKTKDPLNSWNFNIKMQKLKNDTDKEYFDSHILINRNS